MSTHDTTAGARIEIERGGPPSAAELAALVAALTPPARPPGPGGRRDRPWARAALLEAVSDGAVICRPADLGTVSGTFLGSGRDHLPTASSQYVHR